MKSILDAKSQDEITDQDCAALAQLQAAAWAAHKAAADAASALEKRIRMGAKITATNWYWDAELKMVRSGRVVGE